MTERTGMEITVQLPHGDVATFHWVCALKNPDRPDKATKGKRSRKPEGEAEGITEEDTPNYYAIWMLYNGDPPLAIGRSLVTPKKAQWSKDNLHALVSPSMFAPSRVQDMSTFFAGLAKHERNAVARHYLSLDNKSADARQKLNDVYLANAKNTIELCACCNDGLSWFNALQARDSYIFDTWPELTKCTKDKDRDKIPITWNQIWSYPATCKHLNRMMKHMHYVLCRDEDLNSALGALQPCSHDMRRMHERSLKRTHEQAYMSEDE